MSEVMDRLVFTYPQLSLPIQAGQSESEAYRRIVRKGILPVELPNPFPGSPSDSASICHTPAGDVELIRLGRRGDFIRAVQALAHRCEPVKIPDSMGAVTISGVVNWRKLHRHKARWLAEHPAGDWQAEFRAFTAQPDNYRDCLLLVSEGPYSAFPAEAAGFSPEVWLEASLTIRSYHEITHWICRRLWKDHQQAIRDEIVADCIGLLAAFGRYDTDLAARLLGLEPWGYREGGRLQNYVEGGLPSPVLLEKVRKQINLLSARNPERFQDPFAFLADIENNTIGLELWI